MAEHVHLHTHVRAPARRLAPGPFAWSAGRRLAVALTLSGLLWLAVFWAIA